MTGQDRQGDRPYAAGCRKKRNGTEGDGRGGGCGGGRRRSRDALRTAPLLAATSFGQSGGCLSGRREGPLAWGAVAITRTALEKSLIGPAGEHYCLAQLLRRGILAAAAPPGVPDIDLLILSVDGQSTRATVQVKTRTYGSDGGWHMKAKHERVVSDRLFYAFVDFEPEVPVVYTVPSRKVADVLRTQHEVWLRTPGRGGRPHNDHGMRRLRPAYDFPVDGAEPGWMEPYREAWDLIGKG